MYYINQVECLHAFNASVSPSALTDKRDRLKVPVVTGPEEGQ
jgi:hypothetical protein